jgi:hypothetical protein
MPPENGPLSAASSCLLNANNDCGCSGTFHNAPSYDASTGCTVGFAAGGLSGSGQCSAIFTKTCGSTSYRAVCACPQANCVCFFGSSSKVIPFTGCPYCPGIGANAPGPITANDIFTLCGFPQ